MNLTTTKIAIIGLGYPKYTVVAEKFHAVCLLGMTNTRMKDYFDLWVLLDDNALDPSEVRRAIDATFERRKMAMPSESFRRKSDSNMSCRPRIRSGVSTSGIHACFQNL